MYIFYYILIYWSYISFWFLFYFLYKIYKNWFRKSKKAIFYLFVSLVFIYSRFIEPNIITLQKTEIKVWFKANIIVLSDFHLGIYKNENYLERVVNKVNKQKDIDFVVIPWDFTYLVSEWNNNFDKLFSPLSKIKIPIYAILWNHDLEYPGPNIKNNLVSTLEKYNVIILENKSTKIKNLDINILWIWEARKNEDKIELVKNYTKKDNLILIAHTPDSSIKYKNNDIPDITISWHTHWWQIRFPFIYKYIIPCKWDFDQWLYNYNNNKIFVTTGLGEVIYPFRLFIPPVIDVLELR